VDWYITADGADGVNDDDSLSKSDAYLKISFGGKDVRTRAIKNDRSPKWNETFHFKLTPEHINNIHLKLMDDDFGIDDSLGTATISKGDLPIHSGEEKLFKIPMFRKEQASGVVCLRVKRVDEGQNVSQQPVYQSSNVSSTSYPHQQQMPQQYSGTQQPMSYGMNNPNQQYNPQLSQGQQPQMNQPYQQQQQPSQSQQPSCMNAPQYYGQHRY
jgi:hypothetical protein